MIPVVSERRGALFAAVSFVGIALLGGCQRPPEPAVTEEAASKASVYRRAFVAGSSVEGRPIDCLVLGDGADGVLIMATIHGNEPAGTPLVNRLIKHLTAKPELLQGRRVVLMPVANPDGLAQGTRRNVNGVDLNRNFPASNFDTGGNHGSRPLSEPESVAIHKVLTAYRPKRIVSIHQPINYGKACIDYDGNAASLAAAMAEECELPIIKLGSRPGSLGSFAGITLGIPIITVELPKAAVGWDAEKLWRRYGRMLMAAIVFPERVASD
jgi:protein MpaA